MFPPTILPYHLNLDDRQSIVYALFPLSSKMFELFCHKLRAIICYKPLWKANCKKISESCCLCCDGRHSTNLRPLTVSINHNQPHFSTERTSISPYVGTTMVSLENPTSVVGLWLDPLLPCSICTCLNSSPHLLTFSIQ